MKYMRFVIVGAFAVTIAIALSSITGCKQSEQQQPSSGAASTNKTVQYTCTMHPEVVQDKPGKCPKCGMDLVEKK